ncbi:MAG: hypothetical protein JWN40_5987 [Phycisphaerales bacterium]|nr:hypothetical protein [Phycisphaerales bacterium]
MGLLPEGHAPRIAWFQSRIAIWSSNAVVIGTSAAIVTDVDAKATAAADALPAHETAQNAAKAATQTLLDAMAALTNSGNIVIEQVRTKARTAGDGVYPLANIPAPATPTPKPPPGQPTDLKVALDATGALGLSWKCINPPGARGTTYNVFRRIGVGGEFTYLGGSGVKELVDETVPAGAALVMYKIQAVRSTSVGPWNTFNVFFGADTGGAAMVTSVAAVAASPKMAA